MPEAILNLEWSQLSKMTGLRARPTTMGRNSVKVESALW
jgi:hypothetical protein